MRSLYLGRAFGIPLYLHWTFVLLPLYVFYANREAPLTSMLLIQAVLFTTFGCVLLHELGHALMARTFRIGTRDITLTPIGGIARLESMGRGALQEVCIALAGPAVNLVLLFLLGPLFVFLFLFFGTPQPLDSFEVGGEPWAVVLGYLAGVCSVNAMLLLFNLIPAFPMDGGRVLRAALSIPLGLIPATAVAAGIGTVLAVGMVVGGLTFGMPSLLLVGGFVIFAGQRELAGLRRLEAHRKQEEQRLLPPVEPLVPLMRAGDTLDPSAPLRPVGIPEPSEPMPARGGFTGFLWDPEQKVWVRWEDGRRTEVF